jgi:hypothetical protein
MQHKHIHRYVQDRYALKAFKIIEPEVIEEIKDELKVLDLWSIAKMYRILGLINKARKIIDYAIQKFQDDDMVKIEYANILYLTENHNDQEKAHQIINEIIEKKID